MDWSTYANAKVQVLPPSAHTAAVTMKGILLSTLTLLLVQKIDSWILNRAVRPRKSALGALGADEPRLQIAEENDGPRISIEDDDATVHM